MTMTKTQVVALLKENRNERGITHWKKKPRRLKSFGIGLTQLRKLAKQVGRDHKLAQQLWKSDIRAARAIGPVDIDYGDDNRCEPLDVLKHLTSDYLKNKLKA